MAMNEVLALHSIRARCRKVPRRSPAMMRSVALATAMAMAAGSILLGAGPASAATTVSQGEGRFLSGTALSTSLDNIAEVAPASATNDGTTPTTTDSHPLSASVLAAVQADLGSGLNLLGNNGVITLGAGNQYASASADGSSKAAAGAVDNDGAIAVGGTDGVPMADASIDLTPVLGSTAGPGLGVLSAGTVQVGALSATATETGAGVQTGSYQVADLTVQLTSPLITELTSSLKTVDLPAAIGPVGVLAGVPDLNALLADVAPASTADGAITVNIATGAVSVEVAKVVTAAGLDLNKLPANTEIVPLIVTALTTQLPPLVAGSINGLVTQIDTAISGITATNPSNQTPVAIGSLLAAVTATVTAPLTTAVPDLGTTVAAPMGATLSGLLSLTGNVKSTTAGKFTQSALRLTLIPGATPLAQVRLASASVGANSPLSTPTAQMLAPDQGPTTGDTAVTVTGTGFVPGQTSVTIGGVQVPSTSVTVNSSTSLTFTTPAHAAGPASVTVSTSQGTSTPALGFYYNSFSCILTGANAATVTVDAAVGPATALLPANFSVTVGGAPVGTPTPVTPLAGGILQAQTSVPVAAGTTSVGFTLTAVGGTFPTVVGAQIPCVTISDPQRVAGVYHPLQSARLLDTRKSVPLNPGATYTLQVLGRGGVPATNVASLVANVTVTQPTQGGFLTVYPDGSRPNTSSVNFVAGQTVANLMTAPVGADGMIRIYNGSSGRTHVLVDVSGYFTSGDTVAPGSYRRLDPVRILDTNRAIGVPTSTPVPANSVLTLKVTGVGGVQSTNVSAVALNVTVDQTNKVGFITVFKGGTAPQISSLNFLGGQTDANLVIAPVAPDGTIKIKNASAGTVRLIADVSGYFLGGVPVLDGEFVAVTPSRILDTRRTDQPVQALATISPTMAGTNGIPSTGVSAVVLNVTVDHTQGIGYITVFPHDPRPTASNLNFVANQPRPNSVIAPLGSGGKVLMFNGSRGSLDLIADVSGYFISNPLS